MSGVAIITGSGRGIGAATAKLAAKGAINSFTIGLAKEVAARAAPRPDVALRIRPMSGLS